MGIKATHGQVNYLQIEEGQTYQVEVRASWWCYTQTAWPQEVSKKTKQPSDQPG